MPDAVREPTRGRRSRDPFVLLGLKYLRKVRPLLTPAESKVFEELVLECDGWDRPTRTPDVATATGLNTATVRRAIRELDRVGLVRRTWLTAPTSPHSLQRIEIAHEYDSAISALALGRKGLGRGHDQLPIARSRDSGPSGRESADPAIGSHLIARSEARSDPDPPSLPFLPPLDTGVVEVPDMEERREGSEPIPASCDGPGLPPERDVLAPSRTEPTAVTAVGLDSGESSAVAEEQRSEASPGTSASPEHTELDISDDGATPPAIRASVPENTVWPNAISAEPAGAVDAHQQRAGETDVARVGAEHSEPATADLAAGNGTPSRHDLRGPIETPGEASPTPRTRSLAQVEPSPAVPDDLVTLVRGLWGMNVAIKAAHRYVARLLDIGDPSPTVDELARYLKSSAKLPRVQRAAFPLSVVCMTDEFASWLTRYRKLRVVQSTAPPLAACRPPADALSRAEIGMRAQQFCSQLARGLRRESSTSSPAIR